MNKREQAIARMKIAGYHQDYDASTRLLIESGVNREAMTAAFNEGALLRKRGVQCNCFNCGQKLSNTISAFGL